MGVAVADEAAKLGGLVDGGFENPEVLFGTAERQRRLDLYARAMVTHCQVQQIRVRNISLELTRRISFNGLI